MATTVSLWSGTYYTSATLTLDDSDTTKVKYIERESDSGDNSKLCVLLHTTGEITAHQAEVYVIGPSPEALRGFLMAMLVALPVPIPDEAEVR